MKNGNASRVGTALVLIAAVVFLCAGCGSSETAAEEEKETKTLALLLSQEDEFLMDLKENIETEAAAQGYELLYYTAEGDAGTQLRQAHEALAAGAETLIVNLTNDEASEQIAEVVGGANVVIVNRAPENPILHEKMVFVGMDETQSGLLQGKALAEYFWERKQGADIRYLLFQGVPGLENTDERSDGAIRSLTDVSFNPVAAAAYQVCDFYRDRARDAMKELLAQGVEFDCVICNNDAMALGVIEAMEEAGLDPGDVPIVGVDCTADGAAALEAGKLYMTVNQDARMEAEVAVAAAINLDQGRAYDSGMEQLLGSDYTAQTQPYMIRIPAEAVMA
ncbi:MAG: substrate-binding domain-containing protein [Oscillospiraceae bacterium]|nr:substrate-binding domain-containing protein [Oscillospiraceae bacterium]